MRSNELPTPSARASCRSARSSKGKYKAGRSTNANPSGRQNKKPWLNLTLALTHPRPPTPANPFEPLVFGRVALATPEAISIIATRASPVSREASSGSSLGSRPISRRATISMGLSLPRHCASSVATDCFPTVKAASGASDNKTSFVSLLSPRCRYRSRRTCSCRTTYVVVPLPVVLSSAKRSRRQCTTNLPRGDAKDTGDAVEHKISSSANPRVCCVGPGPGPSAVLGPSADALLAAFAASAAATGTSFSVTSTPNCTAASSPAADAFWPCLYSVSSTGRRHAVASGASCRAASICFSEVSAMWDMLAIRSRDDAARRCQPRDARLGVPDGGVPTTIYLRFTVSRVISNALLDQWS
mmetsp:Transcript_13807/g.58058  ORF Transcript_13807/g.58058 Transcript_13807/m.58058 type:complete len:357 (-) Transcript_13807:76-1146(-)